MRQLILPLSEAMFLPLVEELIADGAIAVAVSPAVITAHLQRVFESTFSTGRCLGGMSMFSATSCARGSRLPFSAYSPGATVTLCWQSSRLSSRGPSRLEREI